MPSRPVLATLTPLAPLAAHAYSYSVYPDVVAELAPHCVQLVPPSVV